MTQASRRDVLWTLLGLAVLQATFTLAITFRWSEWRDPAYVWKARQLAQRMHAAEKPFTIVALGTSRTAYGLDGQRIERMLSVSSGRQPVIFNFGIPGGGAVTSIVTLRRLLDEDLRPDHLLIEITPPFLAGQPHAPSEINWLHPSRLSWSEIELVSRYGLAEIEAKKRWLEGCLFPTYSHRFKILSGVVPRWLPLSSRQDWAKGTDRSGWRPYYKNTPSTLVRAAALEATRQEYTPYFRDFTLGSATCTALQELLTLCQKEQIPTSLLLMPEGDVFRGWYSPQALEQIDAYIAGLSSQFSVPVIDARTWVPEDGFQDSHHLLVEGSAIFSDRLSTEFVAPLLAKQGQGERSVRKE